MVSLGHLINPSRTAQDVFQTLLTILITAKKNAEGPYTAKDINCKIPAEQIQRFFKKTYTPKICHLCTQKIGRLDFEVSLQFIDCVSR